MIKTPFFSSERERRLWLWTLAVVAAIFATLGLATRLAGVLRDRNLIAGLFVLGMLLVAITVLTQGLKARPGGIEIAVALGVLTAYMMVFFRMATPTERSHIIEYGVVAVFIYEALTERRGQGRRVPVPALIAILATTLIGAIDEGIQAFLPSRVFDPEDMMFNFLAAVMAVAASAAVGWARRRVR